MPKKHRKSLKYFAEKRSDVHIAAAGSLLGVKMSGPGSFPVGKVNFLQLYPMTFMEFLTGLGESRYRKLLEAVDAFEPLNEAFHLQLIDLLRLYYFVGGMPEAVNRFAEKADGGEIREIQKEIVRSYVFDFLCEFAGLTYPLEVKAGINPRNKSLKS